MRARHSFRSAFFTCACLFASSLLVPGATRAKAPPPPQSAGDAALKQSSSEALLVEANKAYEGLEYDAVLPLVDEVLSREGLTPDQKLDAYLLRGTSLAVIGDAIEAEKPFRLLLRGRPDFDMPTQTPPKILAVFRKVQVEERAIVDQLRTLERERTIAKIKLIGEPPTEATGGYPLVFAYRLRDPTSAVEALRVQYRHKGEPSFSSLAMQRDVEGVWRGAISGEWTASEEGFDMEFYLEAIDAEGPLLSQGNASAPVALAVSPGTVDRAQPPPLPLWSFATVAGVAGVVALAATGTGVGTLLVESDYKKSWQSGYDEVVDGADLSETRDTGTALALTTNVLWISAGVIAATAGVMAFFVNWTGETLDEEPPVTSE